MNKDQIRRFLIENRNVRGQLVSLSQTMETLLAVHDYPEPVANALVECALAVSLMSTSLKYQGRISIQAKGQGLIKLIMVECTDQLGVRGTAQWEKNTDIPATEANISTLLGEGAQMAITLEPSQGERYQGIIEITKTTLAGSIEDYFERSEQLPTRLWLAHSKDIATGMLLQKLPDSLDDDDWHHIQTLADTIKNEELLTLPHTEILHRLFHEEDTLVYDPLMVSHFCPCSRERIATAIVSLGKAELDSIVEEQGALNIDCEFCAEHYCFDAVDVASLFSVGISGDSDTRH